MVFPSQILANVKSHIINTFHCVSDMKTVKQPLIRTLNKTSFHLMCVYI